MVVPFYTMYYVVVPVCMDQDHDHVVKFRLLDIGEGWPVSFVGYPVLVDKSFWVFIHLVCLTRDKL